MRSSRASVIIVTYNHQKYIKNCLNSVLANGPLEVIVVDNGSTDRTVEFLEDFSKEFPQVKLIRSKRNIGYGRGNNLGVKHARGEYVVILNPDTRVERGWLEELLRPLKERFITIPRILTFDGRINACGNIEHFTGLAFTRGLGRKPEEFNEFEYVSGLSGACFAMRREDYLELGGFDERLVMYMEDAEFSWRAHAMGFKILYVPTSTVYHDYKLKVPPEKIYHLERGRYIILRKYLTWRELFPLLPSLLTTEVLTCGYSLLNGFDGIKLKMRGVKDGLRGRGTRVKCDRKKLLRSLEWRIPEDQLSYNMFDRLLKKFANIVYKANYRWATR